MKIDHPFRAVFLAAVCLLTGCLSRPPLEPQSFLFAPPPPPPGRAVPGHRVLGLRRLQIAAPFAGRNFICRTGEFSYERDPYAGFMGPPEDGLLDSVRGWMRAAGAFGGVAEGGSALKPDTLLEVEVTQLYGDFRPSQPPAAVLAMHFVYFDAPNGVAGKIIMQRDYSRNVPLGGRTAEALAAGWNDALAQILEAATTDFGDAAASWSKP
jgi:hypothetical protein